MMVPAAGIGSQVCPEEVVSPCCFSVPAPCCSQPIPGSPSSPLPSFLLCPGAGVRAHGQQVLLLLVRGEGGPHRYIALSLSPDFSLSSFSPERVSPQNAHTVSKILPVCQALGFVKLRSQRLGSFVVWFTVTTPPWNTEGHLGWGTCLLTLPASSTMCAFITLGPCPGAPPGTWGGGLGLLPSTEQIPEPQGPLQHKEGLCSASTLPTSHPPVFLAGFPGPILAWKLEWDRLSRAFRLGGPPSPKPPRVLSLHPPWTVWAALPHPPWEHLWAGMLCVTTVRPWGPGLRPDT